MTTLYTDYLQAYAAKQFDIGNVNFLAMLVDYSYVPDPAHKLDDVTGLIIAVPYVITADDMLNPGGMSYLIDKATADIKAEIEAYPKRVAEPYRTVKEYDDEDSYSNKTDENGVLIPDNSYPASPETVFKYGRFIVMFNPSLEILCYCEPINEHLNGE